MRPSLYRYHTIVHALTIKLIIHSPKWYIFNNDRLKITSTSLVMKKKLKSNRFIRRFMVILSTPYGLIVYGVSFWQARGCPGSVHTITECACTIFWYKDLWIYVDPRRYNKRSIRHVIASRLPVASKLVRWKYDTTQNGACFLGFNRRRILYIVSERGFN